MKAACWDRCGFDLSWLAETVAVLSMRAGHLRLHFGLEARLPFSAFELVFARYFVRQLSGSEPRLTAQ
jgi:hypothetical protein